VDVVEQAVQVKGEEQEPGTTVVLTAEGWEATAYVEPEEDWVVREDGSLESPDGTMRTWMPVDPAGG
jgi:hypothetical protein